MNFKGKSDKKASILSFFGRSPLVSGSLIMFVGSTVASVANYFYHLLMGRMLGPVAYGELESVISVLYLLIIASSSLTLVIAKFTANLKGKNNLAGIRYLSSYFLPRLALLGGGISLLMILLSPVIGSFLHLKSILPFVLAGFYFLVVLLLSFNRGLLQGLLAFKELTISIICENGLKLATAVILVWMGLKVNGAMASFFLGGLAAWGLTVLMLRRWGKVFPKKPDVSKKSLMSFTVPVFLANLSFTSLYTTDVILVKHYFTAHEAGLYAALAVLGKIIFFAASPIVTVMFPMIANHKSQHKNYHHLLFGSLAMVFLICLGAELVYLLFPRPMVAIMFGKDFLAISPLLVWMGAFISVYSLSFLVANFFLSADKMKIIILPVIASLAQIVLVYFFHQTLQQIVWISLLISIALLAGLMLYYGYDYAKTSLGHRPRL